MTDQQITFIVECEVRLDQSAEFGALVPVLESVANEDPGTLEYRWYAGLAPSAMCLYERYRNSEAALQHIEKFGQEPMRRYLEMIKVTSLIMLGPASAELTRQLAPFFEGQVPDVHAARYRVGS